MGSKALYPFSAVVGQEDIKKALLWNLVNPKIGGVLICGQKGTAKSTLVRGVCELTDDTQLVDLPLNITEDRLIGSIDFEYAVKHGEKRFEKGVLYKAHNNVLYIDEVNLLSDHIVKSLVDTASSGINIVEREGMSYSHEAKFIMVGSMNPEEGNLRPQFLDRFGLYVDVAAEEDTRKRTEIIHRRIDFERGSPAFWDTYNEQNDRLKHHIRQAKTALSSITITENTMQIAASIVREASCEGHRAELILIETAKAIAAWDIRKAINISDVKEAARFVLPHRAREKQENEHYPPPMEDNEENPQNEPPEAENEDNNHQEELPQEENLNEGNAPPPDSVDNKPQNDSHSNETNDGESSPPEMEDPQKEAPSEEAESVDEIGSVFDVAKWFSERSRRTINKGSGKRSVAKTSTKQGRYVKNRLPLKGKISDIAFDATLRTAAAFQGHRDKQGMALAIRQSDIRVKVREKRTGNTILFVVDASGSMGANKRMKSVKGAIMSLLGEAYQKRDKVGLIAFRKQQAELVLGITRSVDLAQKALATLPTGGRTPLAAGLDLACDVIRAAKIKDKDLMPVIVLVSDGKATYAENSTAPMKSALAGAKRVKSEKIKAIVIDADESFVKLHLSEKIAAAMDADLFTIEDLQAEDLISAVKMST